MKQFKNPPKYSVLASAVRHATQLAGKRAMSKVIGLTVLKIASGVLDIIGVLLLGQFSTQVLQEATNSPNSGALIPTVPYTGSMPTLLVLFLALAAMTIKSVIAFLATHWLNTVLQRANTEVVAKRSVAELNRSLDDRGNSTSQEVHHALTAMTRSAVGGVLSPVTTLVAESSLALMLLGTMTVSSPAATFVSLFVLGAISFGLYQYVARQQLRLGQRVGRATVTSLSLFQELFYGYRELAASGFLNAEVDRFTSVESELSESLIRQTRNSIIPRHVLETAVMICLGLVAIVTASTSSGVESLVVVTVFAAILARMLPSLIPMQVALSEIQTVIGNSKSIEYTYASDVQKPESQTLVELGDLLNPTSPSKSISPSVVCDKLSYAYPDSDGTALREVSFAFEGPGWYAVHGSSGSGKSTLLDLILGIRLPTIGSLWVNGYSTADSNALRPGTIAFLPQRVSIFNRSLAENVAFGRTSSEIDHQLVETCLTSVGLEWLTDRMEQSPDNLLGEGGSTLSGGQLQRLGIARCLYERPQILILDESTSGLDHAARDHIIDLLHQLVDGGLMLITVSHDLVLTEQAKIVVRLRNGRQESA